MINPTNLALNGCLLGVELAANSYAIRFEWVVIFAVNKERGFENGIRFNTRKYSGRFN